MAESETPRWGESLVHLLRRRAESSGESPAFFFLADGEEPSERLSHAELDRAARALAAELAEISRPGDRVLLLFPPGLDFLVAFFGCLYAGRVAVPAYPPRSAGHVARLRAIAEDAQAALALTTSTIRAGMESASQDLGLPLHVTEESRPVVGEWCPPTISRDDLAYLQYTSGSTGRPKGVMVSHGNLLVNLEDLDRGFGHDAESVMVSWVPAFHDLGLVYGVLTPVYRGFSCYLMAPEAFLARPARWLRAISRFGGTHSSGPNFAYELAVRRVSEEERRGLDLRSWRVALNGAEPIREETLRCFAETYAPYGFDPTAISPGYGLAEAILKVAITRRDDSYLTVDVDPQALETEGRVRVVPRGTGKTLVGHGGSEVGTEVLLVDPATLEPAAPDRLGEIWVAGDTVTHGYWNRPEETAEVFGARLADGRGPYLRTGDLGFFHEGRLFIAGRIKDLIIIRGRNLYPQDVESTVVQVHPSLRPGCGAAFPVDIAGEERLALVQEVRREDLPRLDLAALVREIREAVLEEHEVRPAGILLIAQGSVPKTSSGKIQRRACRQGYLDGSLPVVAAWREEEPAPESPAAADPDHGLERRIAERLGRLLRTPEPLDLGASFLRAGADSLILAELADWLGRELGISIPVTDLYQRWPSPRALALAVAEQGSRPPERREAVEVPREMVETRELPLSLGQRQLCFLTSLDPRAAAAYTETLAVTLRGPLDPALLEWALRRLTERHEALRTVVDAAAERQWVLPDLQVELPEIDGRAGTARERRRRLDAWLAPPRPIVPDGRRPLWRAHLIRQGPAQAVLVLDFHHLIIDGLSADLLLRELLRLHEELAGGAPAALPEPVPFRAFLARQESWLASEEGAAAAEHWRSRLPWPVPGLEPLVEGARPARFSFRGGLVRRTLGAEVLDDLRRVAAESAATPFMALLAGWSALLGRLCGEPLLVLGYPGSGRFPDATREAVGFCSHLLPFPVRPWPADRFARHLETVRDGLLADAPHAAFPLARLTRDLRLAPDPRRAALLPAVVQLLPAFAPESRVLDASVDPVPSPGAKYDLLLELWTGGESPELRLSHAADLVEEATAERLLDAFVVFFTAALAEPETTLDTLPLLTPAERSHALFAWNPPFGEVAGKGVAALFAARAALDPEAPALRHDTADGSSRSLTYGELAAVASHLADVLRREGVRRGERVALLLERSIDHVVASLAVLAAGGAYVPLDPQYPAERLSFLLRDAGARLVLVHEPTRDLVPPDAVRVLAVDALSGLTGLPEGAPPVEAGGDDLAYVMYTSGSTGRPKGIAVPQRAIVRLVCDTDYVRLGPGDRVAHLASTAFDATTFEIWGALLNGAEVVGTDRDVALDPERFAAWLAERRITSLFLTTALFDLVAERAPAAFSGAREVLFGGQLCDPRSIRRVLAAGGPRRLLHVYGPTESTTFATWDEILAPPAEGEPVPIGLPLARTTAHVTDRSFTPLPAGVAGELFLGGEGLAWGYVGRPDLTAESFVPDPWSGRRGARLYRTGDLVRRLADGRIVFLGRRDDQVKIRGFRIEPGEIEAALRQHPDVAAAVVLAPLAAQENAQGERRLVAWVEPRPGSLPDAEALRSWLAATLPDFMIPRSWGIVERLPLNPNGKIDRTALAERIPTAESAGGSAEEETRDPLVEQLARQWAELLGVERVGAHDDFFDLGGHSLLVARVLGRLRAAFGVELAIRDLFDHPTPARMARLLAERLQGGEDRREGPAPIDRRGELPLSFAQQRLWFLDQLDPGGLQYSMPGRLDLARPVDEAALAAALSALIARHETLRTRYADGAAGPVQVIDPPSIWLLPVIDLTGLGAASGEAERVARAVAERPFDLARGPLFVAALIRLPESERTDTLVLDLHHSIADGASLEILRRELDALSQAARQGAPSPLTPLPIQYADFAVWQRRFLTGELLQGQLAFWMERLSGELPVLELPADRPRPPIQSFRGGVVSLPVEPGLAAALGELARREGVTLHMALLGAFFTLLSRLTHQSDLIVGVPVSNRQHVETEGLIGCFVNTLALRLRIGDADGRPTGRWLLARLREVALEAYARQDLPIEVLVDELRLERDLSRNPLFQVLFDHHPDLGRDGRVAGIDPIATGTAICDLALSALGDEQGLLLRAEYGTPLFDAATVERFLAGYVRLLAGLAAEPGAPLADLPLLSPAERAELLAGAAEAERPAGLTVSARVARQAARNPAAAAVVWDGGELTYGELASRAGRLAGWLRVQGVGPEVRVALALPRSPEMVVSILAVLQAGGAWVPLDPADPADRLRALLADAGAALLVAPEPRPELGLPWVSPAPEAPQEVCPLDEPADEQAAYVIYTSGSTGRPKGVTVGQQALARFVEDTIERFSLTPGDRILQLAAVGFDVVVAEILPTLAAGATLVLAGEAATRDDEALTRLLIEQRVTGFEMATHFWNEWLAGLARDGRRLPETLRFVATGTERIPAERLRQWRDVVGVSSEKPCSVVLLHVYGLTEATVTSSLYREEGAPLPAGAHLPIGRPHPGATLHLLDAGLGLVPPGVTGEIHVGGGCLARGYLGQPGLTAERFVPDPYGAPGSRLYRTGDLARRLPSGDVLFLGRIDHQVKLRGVRIEPAEIEAALAAHPEIGQAVVTVDRQGAEALLVAWFVPTEETALEPAALRDFLRSRLPEAMIPARFVALPALPVTAHGKVDLAALTALAGPGAEPAGTALPRNELERRVARVWEEVLGLPRVGIDESFFDLGGTSMTLLRVRNRLREELSALGRGREISLVDLFTAPTVRRLARLLEGEEEEAPSPGFPARSGEAGREAGAGSGRIAIIGMAGRFSGTRDLDEYWEAVKGGVEKIRVFSDEELAAVGVPEALLRDPRYIKAKGFLEGIELFDAAFFGIAPRDAEVIEPQQRLFIETAWHALENAGHTAAQFPGRIGVYAGRSPNYYFTENLYLNPRVEELDSLKVDFGNFSDFVASKVSYLFDLDGPSVNVQSSCSTSLVAIAQACQALLAGQCDLAIAGSVSVLVPHVSGYLYSEGGVFSADGHCRAFDAQASGMVSGEGVGAVVLRRLEDALREGDPIRAVIRGAAVNNDGFDKPGFAAPSVAGQAGVLRAALAAAGVRPRDIGFIEAHGTGTKVGDPTEVAALVEVFREDTGDVGFCGLGSTKPTIGHTDSTSGVAGVIAAVRALEEKVLHPTANFETPNPVLGLEESPFFIPREAVPWPRRGGPRLAGVSSFGVGGTNAHLILEEAPPPVPSGPSGPARPHQLLLLSARTATALERQTADLAAHLEAHPDLDLADVAFTLQRGRKGFEHRRAIVAASRAEAIAALRGEDTRFVFTQQQTPGSRTVGFLFSGQGAQYPRMGLGLYRTEPIFREVIDHCREVLRPLLGVDLLELLDPSEDRLDQATAELNQTRTTQPVLFSVAYAMARLWISWGIRPDLMIGHSMGEYVAACVAGVMTLDEALELVATRGRLTQSLPDGAMLTVSLPHQEVAPLLGPGISIAAINSPHNCVVSGTQEAVAALEAELTARGVDHRRLRISNAFHSVTMEPIRPAFVAAVRKVDLQPPRIPYLSNVTGTWITPEQATDPEYWADQMIGAVRFADGIARVLEKPDLCLLEVGPGRTLVTLTRQQVDRRNPPLLLTSIRHPQEEQADTSFLLSSLGRLWLAGVEVDGALFWGEERRRRVALPGYPFERQRFWVDPFEEQLVLEAAAERLVKNPDIESWFYVPGWERAPLPGAGAEEPGDWLLFIDSTGFGARLAETLRRRLHRVVTVRAGAGFAELAEGDYTIHPGRPGDYEALFEELNERPRPPGHLVHLWSLGAERGLESSLEPGMGSLLLVVRALDRLSALEEPRLTVVTREAREVTGREALRAELGALHGFCRVVPQEHPQVVCRAVDLELPAPGSPAEAALLSALAGDLASSSTEPVVAWRNGHRWVERFTAQPLPEELEAETALRSEGVYLVTGGQGWLGFELGALLARKYRARLVLIGRQTLPPREEWPERLARAGAGETDKTAWKIRQVQRLEELGAEVLLWTADAADRDQMALAFAAAEDRFGRIDGVLHAAGITDESHYHPIRETTLDNLRYHFAPKIDGLAVLEELLAGRDVDFCLVFSSIAAVLGGLGFVGYTAANLVMDTRVERLNRSGSTHWTSVNWDGWLIGEIAEEAAQAEEGSLLALAMTMEEGLAATERILACPELGQVVVSTGSLEIRLDRWVRLKALRERAAPGEGEAEAPRSEAALHGRPQLSNAFEAPRNELERQVAEIWRELLGVDGIGVHDNFFELGGDSLLAVHLSSKLRKAVGVEVSAGSLLAAQTVAEQSVLLVQKMAEEVDEETLKEALAQG